MKTERELIKSKIEVKKESIKTLENEILELTKEYLLISDDKQWFTEKLETQTKRVNRKKVTEEKLIGRIHWIQNLVDGDTDEVFPLERSKVVRVDGEWII